MLDACDRLGVLVMDETFDMWTQPKSEHDYALRFPDWWEADVEAMVRKDFNHPSVILYCIGNEIPEAGTPMGARVGRALAEKIRSLDGTRFVTEAISGTAGRRLRALRAPRRGPPERARGADDETGVNTAMTQIADRLNELMSAPVVAKNSAQTASYLDVVGYNYMESRFGDRRRALSEPGDRRQRDPSRGHRHGLGGGPPASVRDRRLHLDRLGLPRRGGHRAHRLQRDRTHRHGPPSFLGEYPWLHGLVRGHRHHGPPPPAVVLPRDRLRTAHRPLPRGAAARAPRRRPPAGTPWSWTDVVVELELGRARGCAGDGGGLRRRRRGRAAGERPLRRADSPAARRIATGRRSRRPTNRVSLEAVAFRDGAEIGRTALRSAAEPVLLDVERRPARHRRRPRRPGLRRLCGWSDADGSAARDAGPADRRAGRRARRAPGPRAARTRPPRRASPGRAAPRSTVAPWLSSGPPVRAGSRCAPPRRDARPSRSRSMPAPEPRRSRAMTWELRWHPFRGQWVLFTSHRDAAPVDRRDRGPGRAAGARRQRAGARSAGGCTGRTRTTAASTCSPTTSPSSRRTHPSRTPVTTLYRTPPGDSARPRWSATTTTPRGRWPTSRTTRWPPSSPRGASGPQALQQRTTAWPTC